MASTGSARQWLADTESVALFAIINNYNCFPFRLALTQPALPYFPRAPTGRGVPRAASAACYMLHAACRVAHMRINKPYKYLSCVKNCRAEVTVNGNAGN